MLPVPISECHFDHLRYDDGSSNMKTHTGNFIILSLILLFFYGCIDIPTKPPSFTYDGERKIGAILALTGKWAYGTEKQGIDLAVKEINSVGGILGKKVIIQYRDTQSDLAIAYSVAQDLVADDSIAVVIGGTTSSEAMTIVSLFVEARKAFIVVSATAAKLFDLYYSSGYVWRSILGDSIQMMALAHRIIDFNSGSFINVDNEYGNGLIQPLRTYLIKRIKPSFKIKSSFTFAEGTTDFHSLLEPVVNENPEVIVIGAYAHEGAWIVKTLKELNYKGKVICSEACREEEFIRLAEPANAEGVEGTAPYVDANSNFFSLFEKEYSQAPDIFAASAYDATYIVAYTLEKAGDNIADAFVESIEYVANQPGKIISYGSENFIEGVRIIRSGSDVNYIGASGYFDFHPLGLNLLGGVFEYWKIEDGNFITIGTFTQ